MHGRDWILVFVCVTVVWFWLPPSSSLSIVQKWKIPFDTSVFRNSHYPEDWEKLPLPLITDVDGDGFKDIVYVNTNFKLAIADAADIADMGSEIGDQVLFSTGKKDTHLKVQTTELKPTYSTSLIPEFGISFGRRPVALATGYIDPPSEVTRKQVIVVLMEGWVVMCFDHKLNLMWESHAVEEPDPSLFHQEASIMINPTPLTNGDRGIVVVGGRKTTQETILDAVHEHFEQNNFALSEEELALQQEKAKKFADEEFLDDTKPKEPSDEEEEEEDDDDEDDTDREKDHFSFYAFEGHTGVLRWKHEPGDWESATTSQNDPLLIDLFTQAVTSSGANDPSLRLHLFHNLRHLGETKWIQWEDDIREHLPAIWRTREDTSMVAARFDRERSFGKGSSRETDMDDRWQPSGLNELKSTWKFSTPDKPVEKPNVIVVHNLQGFEVIHLYSGRPLCRLEMNPEMLYADINNDGVIDRVETIGERFLPMRGAIVGDSTGKRDISQIAQKCVISVTSGIPATEKLFETSVCSFSPLFRTKLGVDPSKGKSTDVDLAHPAAIQDQNGHSTLYFLVSNGRLASVKSTGKVDWVRDINVKWTQRSNVNKKSSQAARYAKVESFLEMGGFPSLEPFSLYDSYSPEYLVAVGYFSIAIVGADSGRIEADSRLSTVVNGPVVIGDWDNDGDNDIIVPCINGFVGLRVTKGSGTPLYSVLFGIILFSIPVLYYLNRNSTTKKPKAHIPAPYGM